MGAHPAPAPDFIPGLMDGSGTAGQRLVVVQRRAAGLDAGLDLQAALRLVVVGEMPPALMPVLTFRPPCASLWLASAGLDAGLDLQAALRLVVVQVTRRP